MSKLIIIRGNSGSGKSSIAKQLRQELSDNKTALIEQDYLRRHVLGEKGGGGNDNTELIELSARYALGKGYLTIVEGILATEYYGDMLKGLISISPKDAYVFYLDVSLEETIKWHATKPNCEEF